MVIAGLKSSKSKEKVYPYLGIYNPPNEEYYFIVLFINKTEGTLLRTNSNNYKFGMYSKNWDQTMFVPIDGPLIMSRDTRKIF